MFSKAEVREVVFQRAFEAVARERFVIVELQPIPINLQCIKELGAWRFAEAV